MTNCHHDYHSIRINKSQLLGLHGYIYEYIPGPESAQGNQGRNGTLIVHLGSPRIFHLEIVVNNENLKDISMNHRLVHGDVVAFGSKLNAVATHEVLPVGKGK